MANVDQQVRALKRAAWTYEGFRMDIASQAATVPKRERDGDASPRPQLDRLDPRIIGAANVTGLRDAGKADRHKWTFITSVLDRFLEAKVVRRYKPRPVPKVFTDEIMQPWLKTPIKDWKVLERVESKNRVPVGLHTAVKSNGMLRIIFDARPANALTEPFPKPLRLASLPDILGVAAQFGYACSSADVRHWFYQLALPEGWRRLFSPSPGVRATVVPMGWHSAPVVAQCVTWALALYILHKSEDRLGIRPEDARVAAVPPFLYLYDGVERVGAIFVLLDGITVFHRDEAMRRQWMERIKRNAKHFHAAVKGYEDNVFNGIKFRAGVGFRPLLELGAFEEPRTRRDVAVAVGQLLWISRVRNRSLLDLPVLADLLRAYNFADDESFTTELIALLPEERRGLVALWNGAVAEKDEWTTIDPPPEVLCTIRIAPDACPKGTGAVWFDDTGRVASTTYNKREADGVQAHMELLAVTEAVRRCAGGCAPLNAANLRIIIACDNKAVCAAITHGYSGSNVLREHLRELRTLRAKLVMVWVKSEDNAADEISRGGNEITTGAAQGHVGWTDDGCVTRGELLTSGALSPSSSRTSISRRSPSSATSRRYASISSSTACYSAPITLLERQ